MHKVTYPSWTRDLPAAEARDLCMVVGGIVNMMNQHSQRSLMEQVFKRPLVEQVPLRLPAVSQGTEGPSNCYLQTHRLGFGMEAMV